MEKLIGGTLKINNVPDDISVGFMVVTIFENKLWYYGLYNTEDRAKQAANEGDGRFIFKI